MLKSIVRFTILLAMAFSHNALASKHADEIIKLNAGLVFPHNSITINLDKLNPEKNYEIGCYLSSDHLSGNAYDEIYVSSPIHFPFFKINDAQLAESGQYFLPTEKVSYLFAFTNKNLAEITIENQSDKDTVNVSRCYAINYIYGPRN